MKFTTLSCCALTALFLAMAGIAQGADGIGAIVEVRGLGGDVAAVGQYNDSISWSDANEMSAWRRARLPRDIRCVRIVGGCRGGIMILTDKLSDDDADPSFPVYDLQAVDSNGGLTMRASHVSEICDFFDDQIGCQIKKVSATKATLSVTRDGGHTWSGIPYQCGIAVNNVCALKWLSATELIVSKDAYGDVSLFEVGARGSKLRWHINLNGCAIQFEASDEGSVYVRTYADILMVRRQDGKVVTRFDPGLTAVSGMAAGVNQLFIWGVQPLHGTNIEQLANSALANKGATLTVWEWNGVQFKSEAPREMPRLAGVVPFKSETALIFNDGNVGVLQGAQIAKRTATVTEVGPAASQPIERETGTGAIFKKRD